MKDPEKNRPKLSGAMAPSYQQRQSTPLVFFM